MTTQRAGVVMRKRIVTRKGSQREKSCNEKRVAKRENYKKISREEIGKKRTDIRNKGP